MNGFPKIATAIPQRRFSYGSYAVTILGEIEAADGGEYRFIGAFVREGEAQPRLYVVSERTPRAQRASGGFQLRVINSAMNEVMDIDDRWGHLGDFSDQALQIGAQMLGLDDETAYPLG